MNKGMLQKKCIYYTISSTYKNYTCTLYGLLQYNGNETIKSAGYGNYVHDGIT